MSPPLQPVSGLVPEGHLAAIRAAGGAEGISAGLRTVVAAGVLALQSDCALLEPVDRLEELAHQLAQITGRRTASGALWCPTPESMPAPEHLCDVEVLACPNGVILTGPDGALAIDLQAAEINVVFHGGEVSGPVDVQLLAPAAALAAAGLLGLAQTGPGRRDLPGIEGLAIERLPHGPCRISYRGMGVEVSYGWAWCWAAEVLSLAARGIAHSLHTRQTLERQLEVSHG